MATAAARQRDADQQREQVPRALVGITILLVDDDPTVREVVTRFLEREGASVRTGATASEARALIAAAAAESIQVVIADLELPEMNGLQLVAEMRQRQPSLAVLMISGHAVAPEERDRLGLQGQYLHKPFMPSALINAVKDALGSSGDARYT